MRKIQWLILLFSLGIAKTDFTLAFIPDTQYWVSNPDRVERFKSVTQWIVDHTDSLNIIFTGHVGDVTDNAGDVEFQRAMEAMDILKNADVPYGATPGNHDWSGATMGNWNKYFPLSDFSSKAWFGGNYPQARTDNTYFLFSQGGIEFLMLFLEHENTLEASQWALGIMDQYPNHKAIVVTHQFMNSSATRTSKGNIIWDELLYPSSNIVMLVCGHITGDAWRVDDNSSGDPIIQILTDFQSRRNDTWEGAFRHMQFDLTSNEMLVTTYNAHEDIFPQCNVADNCSFTYENALGDIPLTIKRVEGRRPFENYSSQLYNSYDLRGKSVHINMNQNLEIKIPRPAAAVYLIRFKNGGDGIEVRKQLVR